MQNLQEKVTTLVDTRVITKFLILGSAATVLPFLIHIQWLTGPIVNAILILILFLVGIRSAFVICLVPSLMALSGGLLPAILAPVVPFIMISNVIFVLTIDYFYNNIKDTKKSYWIGVVAGAFLKFIFLLISVEFIKNLLIKQELAVKVAQIMSWPQFATVIVGGMIAFIVLKFLKKF